VSYESFRVGPSLKSNSPCRQVALYSRHEVWSLLKRLDFGKPRHEINDKASFSNKRLVEELHVFVKSSQVNTLPKAKSQAKDKRAKDRQ
jgi:hypothetical protein